MTRDEDWSYEQNGIFVLYLDLPRACSAVAIHFRNMQNGHPILDPCT